MLTLRLSQSNKQRHSLKETSSVSHLLLFGMTADSPRQRSSFLRLHNILNPSPPNPCGRDSQQEENALQRVSHCYLPHANPLRKDSIEPLSSKPHAGSSNHRPHQMTNPRSMAQHPAPFGSSCTPGINKEVQYSSASSRGRFDAVEPKLLQLLTLPPLLMPRVKTEHEIPPQNKNLRKLYSSSDHAVHTLSTPQNSRAATQSSFMTNHLPADLLSNSRPSAAAIMSYYPQVSSVAQSIHHLVSVEGYLPIDLQSGSTSSSNRRKRNASAAFRMRQRRKRTECKAPQSNRICSGSSQCCILINRRSSLG